MFHFILLMAEMKTLRIIKFGDQFSNLPSDLIAPAFASFLKPRLTVVAGRLNDFSPEKKVLYLEFLNRASALRGMELLEKIPGTRVDWAGVNLDIYKTVDPDHQTSYVVTYLNLTHGSGYVFIPYLIASSTATFLSRDRC